MFSHVFRGFTVCCNKSVNIHPLKERKRLNIFKIYDMIKRTFPGRRRVEFSKGLSKI